MMVDIAKRQYCADNGIITQSAIDAVFMLQRGRLPNGNYVWDVYRTPGSVPESWAFKRYDVSQWNGMIIPSTVYPTPVTIVNTFNSITAAGLTVDDISGIDRNTKGRVMVTIATDSMYFHNLFYLTIKD